jgi:hypothetical protein
MTLSRKVGYNRTKNVTFLLESCLRSTKREDFSSCVEGTGRGTQGLFSVRDSNQYFCRSLEKISELYLTGDNKGRERPRKKKAGQRNFDNSVSHKRNHIL